MVTDYDVKALVVLTDGEENHGHALAPLDLRRNRFNCDLRTASVALRFFATTLSVAI